MGRLPGQELPANETVTVGIKHTAPVQLQQAKNFLRTWKTSLGSLAVLGASAFVILTDWKVLVQQIPIYGKQFKPEDKD